MAEPTSSVKPSVVPQAARRDGGTTLRVQLVVESLQRQFAACLAAPLRGRGYVPMEGFHALIVEVAPGLAIERLTHIALEAVPNLEPGLLFVEREFGVLELHSRERSEVQRAAEAILAGTGATNEDQIRPEATYRDVITGITDAHAVLINRRREGSMIMPGESLLIYELRPALFAALAANEAERAVPDMRLVDVAMIGAVGRIYAAGTTSNMQKAAQVIDDILAQHNGK